MHHHKSPGPDNRVRVLLALFQNNGKLVPSSAISRQIGITRQGISKIVGILREEGIPVSAIPNKGYLLEGEPQGDVFSPSWAEMLLVDSPMGHPILHFQIIDSTQAPIKDMAARGHQEGAVAVADQQLSGRGRRNRRWESPLGGLYASVLLRPRLLPRQVQSINLACAMAMGDSLETLCAMKCQIKWPNDILVGGRKICGMLSEGALESDQVQHVISGIGLNIRVTPRIDDPLVEPTSVAQEGGRIPSRHEILAKFLRNLKGYMDILSSAPEEFMDRYRARCCTLKKRVRAVWGEETIEGLAEGIDRDGALIIRLNSGQVASFSAGDIKHIRATKGGDET